LLDVQIVFFDIGLQGGRSRVITFVSADFLICIVIILLHQNYIVDISDLQHYTRRLDLALKHLLPNEDWLSSAMHVQVLSQVVLLDSSGNSDFSPGWP
jgi:hypothetical protein